MTDVQDQTSEFSDDQGPVETIEDRKQRSREMIPVVGGQGMTPGNYAGYITVAQGMCKPENLMLKPELRSNIPVVIGLLDIAERARLSVYMLAMKCYVQKGVLCFESQAFHALARPFLDGGLKGEYQGESLDRVLIVRGRLKGDPYEYEHRSPPLGMIHPGHTTKDINGEPVKFVKGSPLWDRKPDMQLWYDTTRDWVRKHCPEAVLGVYTIDEVESEDWKDVTPRPTLGERLAASSRPELREGFRPAAVESSLIEATEDDRVAEEMAAEPIPKAEELRKAVRGLKLKAGEIHAKRQRAGGKALSKRLGKAARALKLKAEAKHPRAQKPRQRAAPAPQLAFPEGHAAAAYVADTEDWIAAATDPGKAELRWDNEYDLRNEVDLDSDERDRLRIMLDEKCMQLRGEK